jgi:hypothetical protein
MAYDSISKPEIPLEVLLPPKLRAILGTETGAGKDGAVESGNIPLSLIAELLLS